ncbi:uncharacterized protein LOC135123979 isoform X2 [Zophobas morio]|uniref:uncharacterized protein LOC135123979 isoform X2 n=1 Tax=Zophobas morio TaxID=2755281 RepID=UPI003083837D
MFKYMLMCCFLFNEILVRGTSVSDFVHSTRLTTSDTKACSSFWDTVEEKSKFSATYPKNFKHFLLSCEGNVLKKNAEYVAILKPGEYNLFHDKISTYNELLQRKNVSCGWEYIVPSDLIECVHPRGDILSSDQNSICNTTCVNFQKSCPDLTSEDMLNATHYLSKISFEDVTSCLLFIPEGHESTKELIRCTVTDKGIESVFPHLNFRSENNNFANLQLCQGGNDSCPLNCDCSLTWLETSSDEPVYSKEYCFKQDGTRLSRTCDKESTGEAAWSNIESCDCEIPKCSTITYSLLDLLDEASNPTALKTIVSELLKISKNYNDFNPFDIYLLVDLISKLWEVDTSNCTDIINNVLNVNNNVLMESQSKMRAIDNWLDFLLSRHSRDCNLEEEKTNVAIIEAVRGIIVEKNEKESKISQVNESFTLEDVLKQKDLESAVWLNSDSKECSRFIYYSKDIFFSDQSASDNIIFGVKLTNESEANGTVWLIYRSNNETYNKNVQCASWEMDESTRGRWSVSGEFQISEFNFICKFRGSGNFAIMLEQKKELLCALSDILTVDHDPEMLSRVLQLSSRQQEFAPVNVQQTNMIFRKVSNLSASDADLENVNGIINNFHKIEKNVLQESQFNGSATSNLLYYISDIFRSYKLETDNLTINSGNFFTSFLKLSDDFSGFVQFNNKSVSTLTNIVNATELLKYENLHSALLLSPELKKQLKINETVRINVFLNNDLFIEQARTSYTLVNNIYGIILPTVNNYNTSLVSTFYKLDSTKYHHDCLYWSQNNLESVLVWRRNTTTTVSSLLRCDFAYTSNYSVANHFTAYFGFYEDRTIGLDWIVNIIGSLSLVAFLCLFIPATKLKNWPSQINNDAFILFNCLGILQFVMLNVSANIKIYVAAYALCVFSGAILHCCVLIQFFWILINLFLYYNRAAGITDIPEKFEKRAIFFILIVPIIIVAGTLGANGDNYINNRAGICFPEGNIEYYTLWWPLSLLLIFILTISFCIKVELDQKRNKLTLENQKHDGADNEISLTPVELEQLQNEVNTYKYFMIRIEILFIVLGLTWVFGLLVKLQNDVIFVYFFVVLLALQGIILFLLYIVCYQEARDATRVCIISLWQSLGFGKSK